MTTYNLFVYLVGWPGARVIKAGVTGSKARWRKFENRGADLHQLHNARFVADGWCDLERRIETHLASTLAPAFTERREAAPFLGSQGGGYMECYRASSESAYADALAACIRIMREHPTGWCASTYAELMHGRTDGRTDAEASVQRFCGSSLANQVQIVRAVTREPHDGLALKR